MNQNNELLEFIYQNSKMGVTSLTELIKDINEKDNKIKKDVEDEIKVYEKIVKEASKLLKKNKQEPKEESFINKMMSQMGVKKEVKKDNSDSSIASMIIQGLTMGNIQIEKKIKNYKKYVNKETIYLANELLEFGEKEIEKLKKYL